MRSYDAATIGYLAARKGIIARRLVWIEARNRSTGQTETMGLCTGLDDLTLSVDGQVRTYLALGNLLTSEPVTAASGLAVRVYQMQLAGVSPEVEDLVKGYETRFAPVELHRIFVDPENHAVVGVPHRVFRGMINAIDFPTAEPGGSPVCTLELVSETRVLTRTLATKKSDDSHKARGGDRFRRYGDISGSVPVYWGELRAAASDGGKK